MMRGPKLALTVAALVALGAWLAGAAHDPARALYAWLVAFAFVYTTLAGALLVSMITSATGASWAVVLRPVLEGVVAPMPLCAVLAVPLLLGAPAVEAWAGDIPFFSARTAVYVLVPALFAELLRRAPEHARARIAAVGIPCVLLAGTFAAFDWITSLEPAFVSTGFGLLVLAGGFAGGLAAVSLALWLARRRGALRDATAEHAHALGKLTFAAICFWAYVAFAHYLLVWIADLPHEVRWLGPRSEGGWAEVMRTVAFGHFALPFALLLFRGMKRRPLALALTAALLLPMHWLHLYWLVLPSLVPRAPEPHLADAAALVATTCACVGVGLWRLRAAPSPVEGPLLDRSLRYRSG